MDDKVNDFLNEINEIAPPPTKPVQDEEWKQCFDELTGYAYYWNKKTDEVTWNPPASFKDAKSEQPHLKNKSYIPPKAAHLLPPPNKSSQQPPKNVKIYAIGDNSKKAPSSTSLEKKPPPKTYKRKGSDSEDEKITLISSYGTDSESEDERPDIKKPKIEKKLSPTESETVNSDDEDDILAKIQKRAQELKELGGDLPAEVKEVVESSTTELKANKVLPGLSLVAGYSDSEEENDEVRTLFQSQEEKPQISHSTLFPIPKAININDFSVPKVEENNVNVEVKTDTFDNKAFQRKRRIGIALVNTGKRKTDIENEDETRKGLGFDKGLPSTKTSDNVYPGIKDGIAFVKADTLNPLSTNNEQDNSISKLKNEEESINQEEVTDMYTTLVEKLTFLNEGRPDVTPVQLMVIQAETLFLAKNVGALKVSYLQKWLKDTCSELIKLEKEATPAGWILQWDKSNKRYFYQNRMTGESQWEYPQPDISRCDDAMDICTTPPLIDPEPALPPSPPLPPNIRSPTPPPPPIISTVEPEDSYTNGIPVPNEIGPRNIADSIAQPLPPGVDGIETPTFANIKDKTEVPDPLNSALDSFYSDIAAISGSTPPPQNPNEEHIPENSQESKNDTVKKKKKTKVKLAPGLAMKKKGVSKLVEKWKNVQSEYD